MPYTPPAQSPGATPNSSRSSSFSSHDSRSRSTLNLLASSNPPRSATYLHKHRRSSAGTLPPFEAPIPFSQQNYNSPPKPDPRASGSLHPSPPPVVDSRIAGIPNGALMSPPDSTQNSSDEEGENTRRGRDLGRLEDELKEAIMKLPQRRAASPDGNVVLGEQEASDSQTRKGHHRTRSEPTMLIDIAVRPRSGSNSSSISDGDEGYREAPAMVRKKSGEVVKSSLKSPGRSRPSSVPSTPTFPPKNVHFDARIEHVRHFLHSEKPSAVSVGSSPVEGVYDAESEYPFGYDDEEPQWDIELPHFPKNHEARKALPVRLEKVCLSTDKKNLIGTVAVANLAFQKHVVARFTFDYWQTISEVTAEYTTDVRRRERDDGVDRFVFKIKLTEQVNLAKKTLFFCVRYNTAGQEFWDNNGGVNFQVDFKKATRTTSNKALPRSRPTGQRPRSMPTMELEGFLDQSFFRELGGHDDRYKKPRSKPVSDEEDNVMPARRANPTGSTFSSRYDFRHSFNTTVKSTTPTSNIPSKVPVLDVANSALPMDGAYFSLNPRSSTISAELSMTTPLDSPSLTGAGPPEIFETGSFWTIEDKPSIESPSYRELLDNYCFFGSSRATKGGAKLPAPSNASPEQKIKQSLEALLPTTDGGPAPPYAAQYKSSAQVTPPALSVAQQKSAGNASPIPLNYAGYHHRRRGSGAFRFDTTATAPTAIC